MKWVWLMERHVWMGAASPRRHHWYDPPRSSRCVCIAHPCISTHWDADPWQISPFNLITTLDYTERADVFIKTIVSIIVQMNSTNLSFCQWIGEKKWGTKFFGIELYHSAIRFLIMIENLTLSGVPSNWGYRHFGLKWFFVLPMASCTNSNAVLLQRNSLLQYSCQETNNHKTGLKGMHLCYHRSLFPKQIASCWTRYNIG